jgi:hypothetical protein
MPLQRLWEKKFNDSFHLEVTYIPTEETRWKHEALMELPRPGLGQSCTGHILLGQGFSASAQSDAIHANGKPTPTSGFDPNRWER